MIAKRDYELIKAIKNHKCCGKSDSGSSDNEQGGGGNTPSGDVTIDDVVKFIHDNSDNPDVDIPTKYNDIKHVSEIITTGYNLVRGTRQELFDFFQSATDNISLEETILNLANYNIVVIRKETPK